MNALTVFDRGAWKARRARRFAVLFYLAYTALALIAIAPLSAVIGQYTANTTWSQALVRDFDIAWLAEFATSDLEPAPLLLPAVGVIALFLFITPFLQGGLISILDSGDPRYPLRGFFSGGAQFYGRLFRLALIAAIFYGLALWSTSAISLFADKIWGKGMEGRPFYYTGEVKRAVQLVFLITLSLIFDYARLRLTLGGRPSAWGATFWAIRFFAFQTSRILGFWLVVSIASVLFFAAYMGLRPLIPADNWALLLILQQLYILSRLWIRFTNLGGELEIFHAASAAPQPPPESSYVPAYVLPPGPQLRASVDPPETF